MPLQEQCLTLPEKTRRIPFSKPVCAAAITSLAADTCARKKRLYVTAWWPTDTRVETTHRSLKVQLNLKYATTQLLDLHLHNGCVFLLSSQALQELVSCCARRHGETRNAVCSNCWVSKRGMTNSIHGTGKTIL